MRKVLLLITAMVLLGLSGCAPKEAEPEQSAAAEPRGQEISAYYYAPYAEVSTVQEALTAAGFEIVATYAPTQKSKTIIITTEALRAAADKPGRGFAAILRVLVDSEHQRIAVTNPVYFGKAFMQKEYDHALALKLTSALQDALGELTASPDKVDFNALATYHFMVGMPTYTDTYELAEGDNALLLDKLAAYQEGNSTVFSLEIGEGRTLVGFELPERTKQFVNKTGDQNAELLPYTILVEGGKASALAAKYYIAICYPLLTMGEFMNIATVPGAIERELEKPFQ